MKNTRLSIILLFLPLIAIALFHSQATAQNEVKPSAVYAKTPVKSSAYEWLDVALEATAREHDRISPRPTVGSRMLMIIRNAMYDAWAAYDDKAVGTRLGGSLRRPKSERTDENKPIAIAYATYRAMLEVFPEDKVWLDGQFRQRGYDPDDNTTDVTKPRGTGNVAAAAVIEYRRHDGANQLGDEPGSNGKAYSDYTFYRPVNPWNKIIDPDCWQPIEFTLANSKKITPGYLTPHWNRVKSFGLERNDMFAVTPALAQPTGCNKIKFQGTYTRTYELPKVVGIGNTTYLMTLELRADRTAARHETSALDYIINSGTGSPGVGSWTCRADGKLVVTILRALYTPIAADIARVEAPNADVQLYRHLRTTHLFTVEDVNTITQIQVRNRFYNATLNEDPTDPTAGTLGLLRTTSTVFTRLTASDADLLP